MTELATDDDKVAVADILAGLSVGWWLERDHLNALAEAHARGRGAFRKGDNMTVGIEGPLKSPSLVRKHVDGPYVLDNGHIRWLSLIERFILHFFDVLPKELRVLDKKKWARL